MVLLYHILLLWRVTDMKILRILLKIILFPFSLLLTVFVAIAGFLIEKCAFILNIISGLLFLGSILMALQYFFGWPFGESGVQNDLTLTIIGLVLAFILSPYGLPTFLAWFVDKLDDLNELIKAI